MNSNNSYRRQYQPSRYNSGSSNQTNSGGDYNNQTQAQNQWAPESSADSGQNYNSELMKEEDLQNAEVNNGKKGGSKKWMKKGLKVSMREKRRRQNMRLRKLLTPKNALEILNQLILPDTYENSVEPHQNGTWMEYIAKFNVNGNEYRGVGNSKLLAKNNAAELVIRDMVIKQVSKQSEGGQEEEKMDTTEGAEENKSDEKTEDKPEEQSFPMIQLASYALHKLFSNWQQEGYKVPQLAPNKGGVVADKESAPNVPVAPKPPKKEPQLPANAAHFHPCMLLSQMRGALPYTCVSTESVGPNAQMFTMSIAVDGTTYEGKAPNKKEARKLAAKKACEEVFHIVYPDEN